MVTMDQAVLQSGKRKSHKYRETCCPARPKAVVQDIRSMPLGLPVQGPPAIMEDSEPDLFDSHCDLAELSLDHEWHFPLSRHDRSSPHRRTITTSRALMS